MARDPGRRRLGRNSRRRLGRNSRRRLADESESDYVLQLDCTNVELPVVSTSSQIGYIGIDVA